MKKLLFLGATGSLLLSVASCSSELDEPGHHGDGNVHFSVELPEGLRTRAFADGSTAKNLLYAVYQDGALVLQDETVISDKTANVNIALANGSSYDFVFWAEAEDSPYTFSAEERQVTVNYAAMNGNTDNGDAFLYIENDVAVNGALNRTVKLTRPFAQLNIGTSDLNNPSVVKTYTQGVYTSVTATASTTLDLTDGSVSEPVEVSLPATLPPAAQETYPVTGDYRYLAMAYLLTGEEGSVSDITINSYTEASSQTPSHTVKVTNAALKRNYRTNIYGSLLCSTTDWNISIDSEFGGGSNVSVWDGTASAPVVDEATKTVTISSASQLAGFAQAVNNGTQYNGYTVNLTSDIDLANKAWTPAGNVVSYPSTTFEGTFNGNGHTIYNLNAMDTGKSGYAAAGLFGSITGKVKDVNLVGGKVYSTHYAGGICGYSSANVGMEISGCSVEGFTIISEVEQIGSSYDNGDKVGGIIGYAVTGDKVTGCTVRNTTIKGYRDIGGIIGYCDNTNVSGCTVEDVTLVQDFENGYKDESAVQGHIGEILGYGTTPGSGNTATNVTITYANRPGGLAAQLTAGGNVTITEATSLVDLSDLNPAKPLNLLVMATVTTMNIGTTVANPTAITIEVADGVTYPDFQVASNTQSIRNLTIKGTPGSSQALAGFSTRKYSNQNFGQYTGNQPKEISNLTFSGVHFDGYGVYMAHNNGMTVNNLVIEGCNFTNMLAPAVSFQAGGNHGNVTIKDNNISFSPSAPMLQNGMYLLDFTGPLTVTGNTVSAPTYHGIFAKGTNPAATTVINGNTIINPVEDGVKVEDYAANVTISGNIISAQANGIRVKGFSAANTVNITGNTINAQNMRAFNGSEPWGILIVGNGTAFQPVINVSGNKKIGVNEHWFSLTGLTAAASSNYANPF